MIQVRPLGPGWSPGHLATAPGGPGGPATTVQAAPAAPRVPGRAGPPGPTVSARPAVRARAARPPKPLDPAAAPEPRGPGTRTRAARGSVAGSAMCSATAQDPGSIPVIRWPTEQVPAAGPQRDGRPPTQGENRERSEPLTPTHGRGAADRREADPTASAPPTERTSPERPTACSARPLGTPRWPRPAVPPDQSSAVRPPERGPAPTGLRHPATAPGPRAPTGTGTAGPRPRSPARRHLSAAGSTERVPDGPTVRRVAMAAPVRRAW